MTPQEAAGGPEDAGQASEAAEALPIPQKAVEGRVLTSDPTESIATALHQLLWQADKIGALPDTRSSLPLKALSSAIAPLVRELMAGALDEGVRRAAVEMDMSHADLALAIDNPFALEG